MPTIRLSIPPKVTEQLSTPRGSDPVRMWAGYPRYLVLGDEVYRSSFKWPRSIVRGEGDLGTKHGLDLSLVRHYTHYDVSFVVPPEVILHGKELRIFDRMKGGRKVIPLKETGNPAAFEHRTPIAALTITQDELKEKKQEFKAVIVSIRKSSQDDAGKHLALIQLNLPMTVTRIRIGSLVSIQGSLIFSGSSGQDFTSGRFSAFSTECPDPGAALFFHVEGINAWIRAGKLAGPKQNNER